MQNLRNFLDYLYTRNAYSFLIQGTIGLRNNTLGEFIQFGTNHKVSFSVRVQNPHDVQRLFTYWAVQTNSEIDTVYWEQPFTNSKITIHHSLKALEVSTSSRRILDACCDYANSTGFNLKKEFLNY